MKFKPLALAAAALLAAGSSQAITYTYSGTTVGGPTFNRPFTTDTLSGFGTAVRYSALTFTVTASGSYDMASSTPTFDNFTLLYSPTFVPTAGLTNLLALNDDLNFSPTNSGFSRALTAGTAYVLVTTSYYNSTDTLNANAGAFTNTITGPGNVVAVPEPQTYALMALGLGVLGAAARRRAAAKV